MTRLGGGRLSGRNDGRAGDRSGRRDHAGAARVARNRARVGVQQRGGEGRRRAERGAPQVDHVEHVGSVGVPVGHRGQVPLGLRQLADARVVEDPSCAG